MGAAPQPILALEAKKEVGVMQQTLGCPECNRQFIRKHALEEHLTAEHGGQGLKRRREKDPASTMEFPSDQSIK